MALRYSTLQVAALALLGGACDPELAVRSAERPGPIERADTCGEASVALIAAQHIDVGAVTVSSDDASICVVFSTVGDWHLGETHLAIAADPADIAQKQGNPIPGQFPYKHEGLSTQLDEFCVPLAEVGVVPGEPLFIAAHASVIQQGDGGGAQETAWGAGHEFPGANWGMYFEHVPAPCEGGACGFRTQTQGGWGTSCTGDNPGCYREARFDAAFPGGLVVGCANLAATLLNSAAVERALPTGGAPRALLPAEASSYDGSEADPAVGTVLFGQVVALTLNVGFDALDDFKQFDVKVPLAELVIVDPASPCVGMSVAAVLAEANLALGGCAAQLPASALGDCAAMINESFVDGEAAGDALCSDRLALPESRPR
ncbi:MAG: hypothetical protein H0T76_11235 [Nannocystis sp.]|nr:hypothetical protein [Nannocystis sp.]MBA3547047.1 hypothetical protein [Nannocystis sp.]